MCVSKLLSDRRGAGTIEYALVASLISIAALAAFINLGGKVDQKYQTIDASLANSL